MKVVVTGASGYIGTRLTPLALKRGHDVVTTSRLNTSSTNERLWFDLTLDNKIQVPRGTDVVVHLAAKTTHTNCLGEECEVSAAQRLIKATQESGARFIFISSQTARPNAPTIYGRIKWRIEQEVLSAGGWVVRPGQVYGRELRGLFGTLANTVRRLPLLPAFMPVPRVQPIHIDDLSEALLRIAERDDVPSGVYCLAESEPISFSTFLGEIALSRLRCRRGFIPVPVVVTKVLSSALGESMRKRLSFLERLSSLFDLPPMETAADLKRLGLTLRPLRSGMHPSGNDRRRCLLREGGALLTYILKKSPDSNVLRRYVLVVERMRSGRALELPDFFLRYPICLSLLDKSTWVDETTWAEFSWRLDAATVLAEATPSGAYRFLGLGHRHGVLSSLISVTKVLVCEVFWRILQLLFFPLIRFSLGRAK
jgi:NADH dehydrogenase